MYVLEASSTEERGSWIALIDKLASAQSSEKLKLIKRQSLTLTRENFNYSDSDSDRADEESDLSLDSESEVEPGLQSNLELKITIEDMPLDWVPLTSDIDRSSDFSDSDGRISVSQVVKKVKEGTTIPKSPVFYVKSTQLKSYTKIIIPEEEVKISQNVEEKIDQYEIEKEGFLMKQGHEVKNWKRRFFRLTPFLLRYYATHRCEQKLGEIHLVGCLVKHESEELLDKKYCFSILQNTGLRRIYYCLAANDAETDEWVKLLRSRHRFEIGKELPRTLSLKDHPKISMKHNVNTQEAHGLNRDNIDSKKDKKKGVKRLVSKKKRRYEMGGYSLDLTYITDRIIAMGFPSVGTESVYRNGLDQVQRFFETRHKGFYRIYNLCSERSYDPAIFSHNVFWFPFDDHQVPCFQDVSVFLKDVSDHLGKDPDNICAIHCKAGKGRTGLMISIFLLYCGEWKTAEEALSYYAFARTKDMKGVTIPSQRRWVGYYEKYIKISESGKQLPSRKRIQITKIRLFGKVPTWDFFTLFCHGLLVRSNDGDKLRKSNIKNGVEIECSDKFVVLQDFQLAFWTHKMFSKKKHRVFSFWLHSQFIENNPEELTRPFIDKVSKQKFNFTVQVFFGDVEDQHFEKYPPYLP